MNWSIRSLLIQCQSLPYGPERTALAERAVREADAANDIELGYEARIELMSTANFGGSPEKLIVAFSWCLSQFDANPSAFDHEDVLWRYKWILTALPEFPQVPREQINKMIEDMSRRYEASGYNQRVVHLKRMQNALKMGHLDAAAVHHQAMRSERRDSMSDCRACECDAEVEFYAMTGDVDQAIRTGQPVFSGGLSCEEVPANTYSHLVRPLIAQQRFEDARTYHERGFAKTSRHPTKFLIPLAEHLLFLACTADYAKGLRLFERAIPVAMSTANIYARYKYYLSAMTLFERLQAQRPRARKVRLPQDHPLHTDSDRYFPKAIANWLASETQDLGQQFDSRNGNSFYCEEIEATRKLPNYTEHGEH